jgi:hypothetical protein
LFVLLWPAVTVWGLVRGLRSFELLAASFKPSRWWWQVGVWRAQSIFLTVVVKLLPYDSAFLPLLVLMVLMVSLAANVVLRPYRLLRDRMLKLGVLVFSAAIYQTSIMESASTVYTIAGVSEFGQTLYWLFIMFIIGMGVSSYLRKVMVTGVENGRDGADEDPDGDLSSFNVMSRSGQDNDIELPCIQMSSDET